MIDAKFMWSTPTKTYDERKCCAEYALKMLNAFCNSDISIMKDDVLSNIEKTFSSPKNDEEYERVYTCTALSRKDYLTDGYVIGLAKIIAASITTQVIESFGGQKYEAAHFIEIAESIGDEIESSINTADTLCNNEDVKDMDFSFGETILETALKSFFVNDVKDIVKFIMYYTYAKKSASHFVENRLKIKVMLRNAMEIAWYYICTGSTGILFKKMV